MLANGNKVGIFVVRGEDQIISSGKSSGSFCMWPGIDRLLGAWSGHAGHINALLGNGIHLGLLRN